MNALPHSYIPVEEKIDARFDVIVGGADPSAINGCAKISQGRMEQIMRSGESLYRGPYLSTGLPVNAIKRIRAILDLNPNPYTASIR